MRNVYGKEVEEIQGCFKDLSHLVLDHLRICKINLKNHQDEDGEFMKIDQWTVNHLQRHLEERCFAFIMKQQPVAKDYRYLSGLIKFSEDYAKISRQCEDIQDILSSIEKPIESEMYDILMNMVDHVEAMLVKGTEGILQKINVEEENINVHEECLDDLYRKLGVLCVELIKEDSSKDHSFIETLQIGKYFERMGDHCEKISQWCQYVVTGKYPK